MQLEKKNISVIIAMKELTYADSIQANRTHYHTNKLHSIILNEDGKCFVNLAINPDFRFGMTLGGHVHYYSLNMQLYEHILHSYKCTMCGKKQASHNAIELTQLGF